MLRFTRGRIQQRLLLPRLTQHEAPFEPLRRFSRHSHSHSHRKRVAAFSTTASHSSQLATSDEAKPKESTKGVRSSAEHEVTDRLAELKRLMQLYKEEKKPLAISMSALTISTAISMCVPFGMGRIIDIVSTADGAAQLPYTAGILGSLFVVGSIANVLRVNTTNMIGERITNRLRQRTYESILRQEMGFFDASRTGELVSRLNSDTSIVGGVLSDNLSQGLRSTGQALGSVTMLFVTCPKLGMIMMATVPPIALGAVSYGQYVKTLSKQVQKRLSEVTELAEEKLGNIRIVRWFAKEDAEIQLHNEKISEVVELARKRSLARSLFFGGVDLSVKMSMLAVLGYGGQMVVDGVLTSGELTSFLMYTIYVGFSFAGMSSFYTDTMKGLGASSRIFELMARKPLIHSTDAWKSLPHPIRGHIQLENVHFSYPTRPDHTVFNGLNLEVQPNETIALVGPSGCGKSSVTALLARFYELERHGAGGRILLDGTDIVELNPLELRRMIGAVSQEPPLFACSIKDNIGYGCVDGAPSMEDVVEAARMANAHEFIMGFPDGYDTIIGERGHTLSGGQKQRVAIARALIKKPRILILDEATSALDQESERLVQEAIDRAKAGRTVLLIAHRPSTIKSADRIAVLSNGRIVEQGTYDALAAKENSVFRQIVLRSHTTPPAPVVAEAAPQA